ncbi:hypothetical protein JCM21900_003012 [Sporobolomyces salmonicolor]
MGTMPFAHVQSSHPVQPGATATLTPFSSLPPAHSSASNNILSERPAPLSWHGKGSSGPGKDGNPLDLRLTTLQPTASAPASNTTGQDGSDDELRLLASPNAKPSTWATSTRPISSALTTDNDPFSSRARPPLPPVAQLSAIARGKRPAEHHRSSQRELQDAQATVLQSKKHRRSESSFLYVEVDVDNSVRRKLRRRQSRPSYVEKLEDDLSELGRSHSSTISTSTKPEPGSGQGRVGPATQLLRLSVGVAADFKAFTDERQRAQQQRTPRTRQTFELVIPSSPSFSSHTASRRSSSSTNVLPPRPLPFPSKPSNHPLQRLTLRPPPAPPLPLPEFAQNPNYEERLRTLLPGGDWIRGTFPVAKAAKLSRPPPRNRSDSPGTGRAPEGIPSRPSSAPVASTLAAALSLSLSAAAPAPTATTTTLRRTARVSVQALPACALPPSAISLCAAPSRSSTPVPRRGRPKSTRTLARERWAQFKPANLGRYTGNGRQDGTNPDPLPWEVEYGVEDAPVEALRREGGLRPVGRHRDEADELVVFSEDRLRALGEGRRQEELARVAEEERFERSMELVHWRFVGMDEGRGRAWDARCGWAGRNPGEWENDDEEWSDEGSDEDSDEGSDEGNDEGRDEGNDEGSNEGSDKGSDEEVDQLESSEDEVMMAGMDVEKRLLSKGKDKVVLDDPDSDNTDEEEIRIAAPAASSPSVFERDSIALIRPSWCTPSAALAAAASSSRSALNLPRPNDDSEKTEDDEVGAAPVVLPPRPTAPLSTLPARHSGLSAPVEDAWDVDPSGMLKRCTLSSCPQRLYRATSSTSTFNHARAYHSPLVLVRWPLTGRFMTLQRGEDGEFKCPWCPYRSKAVGSMNAHGKTAKGNCQGPPAPEVNPASRAARLAQRASTASSRSSPPSSFSPADASTSTPTPPVAASVRRDLNIPVELLSSPAVQERGEGARWGGHTRWESAGEQEDEQNGQETGSELGEKEQGKGKERET